ncbi:hypothetical protein D6764_05100 [Candidatus Woesearchaeota archaeon]|nr:MAG: hypothetical protein D6764_05100 [Candidatus Woesearchaeota archaeon]
MNKKGQHWVLNLTEILPLVIIITLSIVTIVTLTGSSLHFAVDSFDAEATAFATELLYAKGGLSYYDEDIGRVYPGLIDMERVQDKEFPKKLAELFNTTDSNRVLGAKIQLSDYSGNIISITPLEIIYNKNYYQKWSVLANRGYKGPGGARKKEISFLVSTLYPDGRIYDGTLSIEVVKSNS